VFKVATVTCDSLFLDSLNNLLPLFSHQIVQDRLLATSFLVDPLNDQMSLKVLNLLAQRLFRPRVAFTYLLQDLDQRLLEQSATKHFLEHVHCNFDRLVV